MIVPLRAAVASVLPCLIARRISSVRSGLYLGGRAIAPLTLQSHEYLSIVGAAAPLRRVLVPVVDHRLRQTARSQ